MLLREQDSGIFKQWLLPKLETISDADAEVLADYVIALVTANDSEANIRRSCIVSLADFLQDNTKRFVEDVLKALRAKSYAGDTSTIKQEGSRPGSASNAAIPSIEDFEYDPEHPHLSNNTLLSAPTGPAATRASKTQSSRKRKAPGRDKNETFDNHYANPGRQTKQTARRSGKNTCTSNAGLEQQNASAAFPNMANFPPPPPGLPPFDMSNPMAVMAMMAALGVSMPGMPSLPTSHQANGQDERVPCRDYHERGFCAAGVMCPYEHGDQNSGNQPMPAYDSIQSGYGPLHNGLHNETQNRQTRTMKGGRARASFSMSGPTHDRSNTTLVIEQIPQENLSEDEVRDFFTQFGPVTEVKMYSYRRLAIVKYEDHSSAQNAYRSPKAVFENRFVKVYWHKPEDLPWEDLEMGDDQQHEILDLAAIEKRQAEAQKAFEERRRKQEAADARAAEIDRLLKEKDEEMKDIKKQLAALAAGKAMEGSEAGRTQTLADLQAEAETLFAQMESLTPASAGRGHPSRGGYQGYGAAPFPPRGRGYAPRGARRGRGAYPGSTRGGRSGVKRLDNRPRRLAVLGITKGSAKDEALRQFLVNMPECTSIEHHPEQPDTLILGFGERYHAEAFLDSSRNIPDVGGPLELSWIPNDALGSLDSTTTTADAAGSDDGSSDTLDEHVNPADKDMEDLGNGADADMDVADDVDRWL